MKDDTTNLLGLEDVVVKKVENINDELHIEIELPRRAQRCPCCKSKTEKIHDYRNQCIRDLPAFGKKVYLHLRKRRYICKKCGKRFYENNSFLPKYSHVTQRLVAKVIGSFHETVSATHIAKENNISVSSALRYFDLVSYGSGKLSRVLSIDEFKGNAGGEKFQTIITDASSHTIKDILPSRKTADLVKYFMKFPRKQRLKVKYVVMDMSKLFLNVAKKCFPKAIIVADKYHVVRQAIWAMENVRKRVQKKLSPEWRKFFKRSKRLLSKDPAELTAEELDKVRVILGVSQDLEYAYKLKNDFLKLIKAPDSETGRKLLGEWVYLAENANLAEFQACTKAVHNWSNEILASFDCTYTNGYTEGCNNKTKVIKRVCFGVRNFRRFRNRILYCAT